ncbi:hypothetical protein IQ264_25770 [Phormidium sp. LEGE 05292]|uniref:hypothetical protein n=1 Tax=[Phormidium] sp. LEGE 05292 TaxID=767427 RepID=UPI001881763B|nr:hypothetical protein [Phormidium sp. LEGE 05292]MBE9228824.1 hypothetical protein [Phormidium sp. LEGE 05292]
MSQQFETKSPITSDRSCEPCQTSMPTMTLSTQSNGSTSQSTALLNYPTENPPATVTAAAAAAAIEDYPTQEPPSQLQLVAQSKAVSAGWQTDKKITGLWSICSDQRNAFMYVDGMGWRKFADNSDSAIMAFNIIAAHAKVTGKGTYFYEGDDGKVNTLYVW